ncbi:MAG: diguanylate cyclase domain-containing protein, partial [Acidimicrobiales bacterium]
NSERIAPIADSLPTVLWEADHSTGDMLSILGSPERVLRMSVSDLLGAGYARRIDASDRGAFSRRFWAGDRGSLTYRFRAGDGTTRWLTDQIEEVEREGRRVLRGITIDVTELHQAQETVVRQSEIVERMSAATFVISGAGSLANSTIVSVSDPLGDLLDRPLEAVGLRFGQVLPELASRPWLVEGMRDLESAGTIHTGPHNVSRGKAEDLVVEVQLFSMPDNTTALIVENVTVRERAQDTVRHQALHDALTNLPNRMALMDRMELLLERSEPFSFALLDLNRFKAVNDTLGHLTGDELLRIVALRLSRAVGSDDVVARLGGDEFAIIFSLDKSKNIEPRVKRVIDACRDGVSIRGSSISIGVSIGLANAPQDGSDPETLLRLADVAMYNAKRSRNTVNVYEAKRESGPEQLELMAELDQAFAGGQFVPYLQPKCDAATGEVIGAEALARWLHPTRGVLLPVQFMDLISVSGRLDDLLGSILRSSVRAISELPDNLHIALNLSAVN